MALINCNECGAQVSDKAPYCPKCGAPVEKQIECSECGTKMSENIKMCPNCGCPTESPMQQPPCPPPPPCNKCDIGVFESGPSGKSRGVAALLAILLGGLGVHLFYVGKTGAGVLFLLCGLIGWFCLFIPWVLVWVVSIIQGIMLFTMTSDDFEKKYINGSSFIPF